MYATLSCIITSLTKLIFFIDIIKNIETMLGEILKLAENTQRSLNEFLEEENIPLMDSEIYCLKRLSSEVYHSFFMKALPMETWKSFFTDYQTMAQDFFTNPFFKNDTFIDPLNIIVCSMFQKEHDKYIRYFKTSYGFSPILHILQSIDITEYEKMRQLRQVCAVVGDDARVYRDFTMEHWTRMMNDYLLFLKFDYSHHRICMNILGKVIDRTQETSFDLSFLKFFTESKIRIETLDNTVCELTFCILSQYFHPDSHVEGNVLWIENRFPRLVYYREEPITEDMFRKHSMSKMTIDVLKSVPMSVLSSDYKNQFMQYFYKKTHQGLPFCMWNFVNTSANISFYTILERCFHIYARISSTSPSSRYHVALHSKIQNQILNLKHLHHMPLPVVFPEWSVQSKSIQQEWKKVWEVHFHSFLHEFLTDFCVEYQAPPSPPLPPYPEFQLCGYDQTEYIGTQTILEVLQEKKTYTQFIQLEYFFPKVDETTVRHTSGDIQLSMYLKELKPNKEPLRKRYKQFQDFMVNLINPTQKK